MNILFVCTGNTCRSCMAESIFNLLSKDDTFFAKSAGIAIVEGSTTSINSSKVLNEKLNLDISKRKAVQLNRQLTHDSDLIITMTAYIRDVLVENFPESKRKIHSLNDYVGIKGEIIDPYGGTVSVYEDTFKQLKSGILLLLNKLREDKSVQ
ncbi:low molecular weight protein arginine phosphatase [Clostridium rectalis]|uniref:low molecular weight protein arginine phosphatase n=1 Tax=Clostridium rectalis TaxID=2040295 RepID=UPI000F630452|nr:low molecular weight protein arginine phosphatase [Clostridium rectalis]